MKTSYFELSDFLIVNLHFCVKNSENEYSVMNSLFKKKPTKKRNLKKKFPKIARVFYYMKVCLRFSTFTMEQHPTWK